MLTGLLVQFEQSQWWSPERLKAQQDRQRASLLSHAYDKVPYYKAPLAEAGYRPGREVTDEIWSRIPILDRQVLAEDSSVLKARSMPKGHGRTSERSSSGSSGRPIKVVITELATLFRDAGVLRDILWHRIDTRGKLAAIRGRSGAAYPKGTGQESWSPVVRSQFETGPAVALSSTTEVPKQALWLQRENPDHLMIIPHNLFALAEHCRKEGIKLDKLRGVSTYGGVVRPEDRQACREAWGVEIYDVYSAEESGYMALQCPLHEHYHVQAEAVILEIIDEAGKPCAPGQRGRVIVTALHNFAMPLIRYDLGDYAEFGEPCDCGRGLPVVRRIHGRTRDMLTLPSGGQVSPVFVNDAFKDLPVRQFQIVQDAPDHLEVKIVQAPDYRPEEQEALIREVLSERLPADYAMTFSYHDKIEHTPGGKYFDFRSLVSNPE